MASKIAQELFSKTLEQAKYPALTEAQIEKFKQACQQVIENNPDNDMQAHIIGARIHLNFIRSFPDLELPANEFPYED